MQQSPKTIDETLRSLRVLHGVILFAMLLYVYSAELVIAHQTRELNSVFPLALGCISLVVIGMARSFRMTKIRPAFETLRSTPDDLAALRQWRIGGTLTAVLVDVVALFGFALRVLGAPLKTAVPFYAVGIGLMILWWPQRP
jgi:hypothetical protein